MELEEMKSLWSSMSDRLEKLEVINEQRIMEITQLKYKNKFRKLTSYETSGAVICFLMGLFVLFNVNQLDTWYLLLCGLLVMAFLFTLPILSLQSLRNISKINISQDSYKKVLKEYESAKNRTLQIQRVGLAASFLMMFVTIPVADKILNGNDFFQNEIHPTVWVAIAFGTLFVFLVGRWGLGWYKKITNSAENLLKDLED